MKKLLTRVFVFLAGFLAICIGILDETCQPIHAQGHGINLICCSKTSAVNPDCEFHYLCRSPTCKCHVFVSSLSCDPESANGTYSWSDHAAPPAQPFPCQLPNFPNQNNAEFVVQFNAINVSLTSAFISGLSSYKITSLIFESAVFDDFLPAFDISGSFPALKTIFVKNSDPSQRPDLDDLSEFIGGLENLEHLTLINVDFEFGAEPKWLQTVSKIHVENSSLSELPKWMASANNMKKLTIKGTKLVSAVVVSQLRNLMLLNLDENAIADLHGISFASENVLEISLKNNQISSIGAHTFLQNSELRILDLSGNRLSSLPSKSFQKNGKMKVLALNSNRIQELRLDQFIGLQTLRTLSLSNNPLKTIDPFAFLPLAKSLRILELNGCNLTRIPLAVTQCCLLERLELNDNKFFDGDSMPSEVLALLSGIKQISFERNPLLRMPEGLFLIPETNTAALEEVLDTLIKLPVWRNEPCTPFIWHIYLTNSSASLRRKVGIWNDSRMQKQNLGHCEFIFEKIMENLQIYRELAENSGCEANRRLRRVRDSCIKKKPKKPRIKVEKGQSPSGVLIVEKPLAEPLTEVDLILVGSLLTNALFVVLVLSGLVFLVHNKVFSQPKTRNGFEEIQGE